MGWSLFFKTYDYIKKDTPIQAFSCEYYEIFKHTFLKEQTAASEVSLVLTS